MRRLHSLFNRTCLAMAFVIAALSPGHVTAQDKCTAPSQLPTAPGQNIFTPVQESDLGDVIVEEFEKNYRVIEDDSLTAEPNRVVQKLLQQTPSTGLRIQVYIVDQPFIDAYSFPGGRIYVSRKLIAFIKNEDELAGLLAHELGHIITHQSAMTLSRMFREVLNVASVGDRNDIFAKYNSLLDTDPRKQQRVLNVKELESQFQADQVALQILGAAGYSPRAFTEFYDRLAQTKGKTGSWFSNAFGFTAPDQKRLLEMRKSASAIPEACLSIAPHPPSEEFELWQNSVIGYSGLGRKDVLRGLVAKRPLNSGLRNDLSTLLFSPDGKYAIAQDESNIYVLSIEPFAIKFGIDAPRAERAKFSPDGQFVLFSDHDFRVEKWSVADERRTSIHDIPIRDGCLETELSPDGKHLACFDASTALRIFDAESGAQVFEKKEAFPPENLPESFIWYFFVLRSEDSRWVRMEFSPDAKYFIAARATRVIALDTASNSPVAIKGALKSHLEAGFTFVGPDQIFGMDPVKTSNSIIAQFPSGNLISNADVGSAGVRSTGCSGFLFVSPIKEHVAGIFSLDRKRIFLASDTGALDACGNYSLSQRNDASIVLNRLEDNKTLGKIQLPQSSLTRLRVAAASPDLQWFAVSTATRGAVWNIATANRQLYMRGFRGAFFDADQNIYSDFPVYRETERTITKSNLRTNQTSALYHIPKDEISEQYGAYRIVKKRDKNSGFNTNITFDVYDVRNDTLLWSQKFPKNIPEMSVQNDGNVLLFWWDAETPSAKDVLNANPELKAHLNPGENKSNCIIEIREASTGKVLGRIIAGSPNRFFSVKSAFAADDWVGIVDNENRTQIYSMASGTRIGAVFGSNSAIFPKPGLLAVENQPGHVQIYSLPSMEKISDETFSSAVAYIRFNRDGTRMLLVTSNQTAYLFDTAFKSDTAAVH